MAEYTLGVDLGGTKVLASVVNEAGEVIARSKKRTKPERGAAAVIERIAKSARSAVEESGVDYADIKGVGVCAPGMINRETGVVLLAPNLDGWENVPLKMSLERLLEKPVCIDNDVNLGTWGEYVKGAGRGAKVLLGVFVGTGIGGGIIINGDIYGGANNAAGEFGHMRIVNKGPECGCGLTGHWEALAGRLAIANDIKNRVAKSDGSKKTHPIYKATDGNLDAIRSGAIAEALGNGGKVTTKAVKKACEYLGINLANLIHCLDPDKIVLGGGVTEALGANFVYEVVRQTKKNTIPVLFKNVEILPAELGDDAGIVGAALYARRCFAGVDV